MVGWLGISVIVTTVAAEIRLVQPDATLRTVNEPEAAVIMLRVVAPVLQILPAVADDCRVTEPPPPVQKVVGPLAEIVGVAGNGVTTTVALRVALVHPLAIVLTT